MGLEAMAWLPFGSGRRPCPLRCHRGRDPCGAARGASVAAVALRGHTLAAFQANLRGVEMLLVDGDDRVHHIETAGKPRQASTGALV
ncbi:MAG TPA: hypothetical protein VJ735_05630 [Actinomycetes bacterium]|nr:hypothetical protein [Actinomycetes bacterium]